VEEEIAEWLRGQAEEDIARAGAATPGPWEFEGDDPTDDELFTVHDGEHGDLVGDLVAYTRGTLRRGTEGRQVANGRHMERHDPLTETARAESVLAVLDAYEAARKLAEAAWEQEDEAAHSLGDQARALGRAVRLLAYGYRHREGGQETWKP
jgi:hypothetical protein